MEKRGLVARRSAGTWNAGITIATGSAASFQLLQCLFFVQRKTSIRAAVLSQVFPFSVSIMV